MGLKVRREGNKRGKRGKSENWAQKVGKGKKGGEKWGKTWKNYTGKKT